MSATYILASIVNLLTYLSLCQKWSTVHTHAYTVIPYIMQHGTTDLITVAGKTSRKAERQKTIAVSAVPV